MVKGVDFVLKSNTKVYLHSMVEHHAEITKVPEGTTGLMTPGCFPVTVTQNGQCTKA